MLFKLLGELFEERPSSSHDGEFEVRLLLYDVRLSIAGRLNGGDN